ncbi:MAG: hemolysin family protein [Rhodospirillales bacterium]|nr:hemolysin family protein [Rhodospirillales bacterium]
MNEEPSPSEPTLEESSPASRRDKSFIKVLADWLGGRNGETARDALEELIDESDGGEGSLNVGERQLLGNILDLHERTISDVMVPRVDITAFKADCDLASLIALIGEEGHSRMPLYRETLDDAFGMVHVKDVLAWRGRDEEFDVTQIVRPVLFVAPSMHVLELLLEMRSKRIHMALVVDEFGGVDGLVTIEDLVEEIVGEIEDEFDEYEKPSLEKHGDGSWTAGARTPLEDLETAMGRVLFSEEERDEVDTLGGLVFTIAGRVPVRGELLRHERSKLEFEVLEVDLRHIKRLRIHSSVALQGDEANHRDANVWKGVDWAERLLEDTDPLKKPATPKKDNAAK